MIIENLVNGILFVIRSVFSVLPNIPNLPDNMLNSIDSFFEVLKNSVSFFYFFVSPTMVKSSIAIIFIISQFENIYKFTMFIIKKIPFINVE